MHQYGQLRTGHGYSGRSGYGKDWPALKGRTERVKADKMQSKMEILEEAIASLMLVDVLDSDLVQTFVDKKPVHV